VGSPPWGSKKRQKLVNRELRLAKDVAQGPTRDVFAGVVGNGRAATWVGAVDQKMVATAAPLDEETSTLEHVSPVSP
jgi:hypothetical protein